jgi:hypothetical protein
MDEEQNSLSAANRQHPEGLISESPALSGKSVLMGVLLYHQ